MEIDHRLEIALVIIAIILIHGTIWYLLSSKPKKINGKHVVVTGGSSGIGLWAAIDCAKRGAHVTIVARNAELLEKAKTLVAMSRIREEQKIETKSVDLSKNYEVVSKAFSEIEEESGEIYMLINCAGMAICGVVEEMSIDDVKYLMDVNYFGTFYPTKYVLPKMKTAGEGIIVITASQGALMGIYGYGAYAASKFALRGLAETIEMESKSKGISVTLALPADTDTPGLANENKTKPIETHLISGMGGLANPKDVGQKMVADALKGSFFSVLGFESWILSILCVGMAPWKGLFLGIVQFYLLGPLRLIGLVMQYNFQRIIKKCAKDKKN